MWGKHWRERGLGIGVLADCYARFDSFKDENVELDLGTKDVALRASSYVVSLICHAGKELLSVGSGTIIECTADSGRFHGTILTSATLLRCPSGAAAVPCDLEIDVYLSRGGELFKGQVMAFDFHYGVATVKIKSSVPLSTATVRFIDDSLAIIDDCMPIIDDYVAIDPKEHCRIGDELADSASFQLRPHRDPVAAPNRLNLYPGELVIALGRYFRVPYDVMAAPGVFRAHGINRFDCKELFATSCTITRVGIGGPLINCHGEVIGINFFAYTHTAFLPINIAFNCLENFKRNRRVPRPWLGLHVANLYTTKLDKLEKLNRRFPDIVKGVVVEEIMEGKGSDSKLKLEKMKAREIPSTSSKRKRRKVKVESPAKVAGLCVDDVIINCGGNSVGSHLEFIEALWDQEGKPVEMVVVRPSTGEELNVTVTVETSPLENEWPAQDGILPTL